MWLSHLWWWVEVHTGTVNESGAYYGFWSGFGSDLGELTILGGVIQIARHANCHSKGCWRIAKHPVEGTPYKVCRKCHPTINGKPTRADIHAAHTSSRGL